MGTLVDTLKSLAQKQSQEKPPNEINEKNEITPSRSQGEWAAEDWRDYYLERSAIRQYDGGLTRDEANRRAWRETANRWWHEHGSRTASNICAGCLKPVAAAEGIPLPHDQRVHDADCMGAFGTRWLAEAAAALAGYGVPSP